MAESNVTAEGTTKIRILNNAKGVNLRETLGQNARVGDEVDVTEDVAKRMVESNLAALVEGDKPESGDTAVAPQVMAPSPTVPDTVLEPEEDLDDDSFPSAGATGSFRSAGATSRKSKVPSRADSKKSDRQ